MRSQTQRLPTDRQRRMLRHLSGTLNPEATQMLRQDEQTRPINEEPREADLPEQE